MMTKLALWLEAHTGRILAVLVTASAGISVYAGVHGFGIGLLMVASYALGAAWDADTHVDYGDEA
jgi:F420-0:gamma-glutamyl ligase